MHPIYQFMLKVGASPIAEAHPVYSGELALDYTKEAGQEFFRRKLSGKLSFVGADYDAIVAATFTTKFSLTINISYDAGATWTPYWHGHFYKTDCEFDADAGRVQVTPTTEDDYDAVLAGLDKEFNLIKLAPAIAKINADKRGMMQIYVPGQSTIGCFLSGMWWEQECDPIIATGTLTQTGNGKPNFGLVTLRRMVECSGTTTPQIPAFFEGAGGSDTSYSFSTGAYEFFYSYVSGGGTSMESYRIRDTISGATWAKQYANQAQHTLPFTLTLDPVTSSGASGTPTITVSKVEIYGRVVCDVATLLGNPTYKISGTDAFVTDNRNYSRVQKYENNSNLILLDYAQSLTPTEWGLAPNGRYYTEATGVPYCFPVARNGWGNVSMWFAPAILPSTLEEGARAQFTFRDTYPIWSVISVLLGEIAPGITHSNTTAYSQFLYGTNIAGISQMVAITPKSNVTNLQYDQPAQKAPITLGQVLDMLAKCFRCYWYIDSSKRFRIEHIYYFMNGGSYNITPSIGIDLTAQSVSRSGKAWATGRNQYTFDKPEMVARYEFGWMDDVSVPFEGAPINILSPYVQPGNIEKVQVMNFTSDVDYIILNPGEVSQDGFVLFAAQLVGGYWTLPYEQFTIDGVDYEVQNGLVAFACLQQYYEWDMPGKSFEIDGVTMTATGTKRLRTSSIKFPLPQDPDTNKLVKTEVGQGNIEKLSINLSSRTATATLRYDTE